MENRRMCPNCRAFVTSADRVCPYCGVQLGPGPVDLRPREEILGGMISHAQFTTVLILLINFGLFIASTLLARSVGDNIALYRLGAKFGPSIFEEHQWWRLVTAGFLHANVVHIGMNSWALYQLGAQVEAIYGTPRYLVIYLLSTVGGYYCSALMNPGALSLGSSAGIAGLVGMMIAFGVANRSAVGRVIRNFYLQSVVYMLAIGLWPGFRVDNWAHIGGLAAGFIFGYIAGTPLNSDRGREAMWRALAGLAVLVTLVCFMFVWLNFSRPIS